MANTAHKIDRNVDRKAARPADAGATDGQQYLSFTLGKETFAVPILMIKEIIEHRPVRRIPMAPAWVSGVINLRGTAVPVVELSARLGRPTTGVTKRTCVVVVETATAGKQRSVGLIVDTVNAVLDISAAQIEPVPPFGAKIDADLMKGVGKVDGRFVILLDMERIVSAQALQALAAAIPD